MSEVPTPELFQGELDDDALDALFADLAACAEIQHIKARGADETTPLDLESARELLSSGRAKAIQILYRFEGEGWCDTLMAGSDAVRLVRVRQDPAAH